MDREKFLVWCVVKRNLAKNSIRHTRQRYDLLFKWLNNKPLTAESVESFVLYLREKGLRNASMNSYIRVVNLIDIYERENGNDLNLLKKISYFPKEYRVPTILTMDEIDAILSVDVPYGVNYNVLKENNGVMPDINRTYKLLWWLVASTGCRIEEALGLRKEHLQLGLGKGKVVFTDTKTRLDRKVPLPPLLVMKLQDYIADRKPAQYVFLSSLGNRIPTTSAEEELKKRVGLAGINKRVHPHCFRNSYIMEHYHHRTDPFTISRLVGHRDINTTLGYMKFDDEDLEKGAENHPLFARNIEPVKILKKVRETIDSFRLIEDYRLEFEVREDGKSLDFHVGIKEFKLTG